MYDLIVIGAGPAGLSAALYAARAGMDLLVLERSKLSGGQILNTYEVDNYLGLPGVSGADMAKQFRGHVEEHGVPFVEAQVKSIEDCGDYKLLHTRKADYETRAVLLATGARYAELQVPGEARLKGRGVSYCATCDGAFFQDKTVAVIGGGNTALEDAIYLARKSRKVYLIHRREQLRGMRILQERLKSLPNVELLTPYTVSEIIGETAVEGLALRRAEGKPGQSAEGNSEQDAEMNPEKNSEKGEYQNAEAKNFLRLDVEGVFIAVGTRPCTELVRDLVDCDEAGYVLAGEDGVTSLAGIFAAGDVRRKPLQQVITAVADGANAAASVGAYLNHVV